MHTRTPPCPPTRAPHTHTHTYTHTHIRTYTHSCDDVFIFTDTWRRSERVCAEELEGRSGEAGDDAVSLRPLSPGSAFSASSSTSAGSAEGEAALSVVDLSEEVARVDNGEPFYGQREYAKSTHLLARRLVWTYHKAVTAVLGDRPSLRIRHHKIHFMHTC